MAVIRAIWRGSIASSDIWQAGWHAQTGLSSTDAAAVIADKSKTLFDAMFTGTVVPQFVRVEEINEATGALVSVANASIVPPTQTGVTQLPAEVAACVTIRPVSGLVTGRFYLPSFLTADVTGDGRMTLTKRDAVLNKLQTFFQTDIGGVTNPIRLGIYSRKDKKFVGARAIEMGDVYDSQRRRRNKQLENRGSRGVL